MIVYKTSTSGNDFLIVDRSGFNGSDKDRGPFAIEICSRKVKTRADGVIFFSGKNDTFDFSIFNKDGSEAEISGNGMAGLSSVLFATGRADKKITLRTTAGNRTITLIDSIDERYTLRVDMGFPEFNEKKFFPFLIPGKKEYEYKGIRFYPVSTGNPHAVVILDTHIRDLSRLEKIGSEIESGEIFPERTNVEFVFPVKDPGTKNVPLIEAFFYERGAGVTPFSSTGSTAVFSVLHSLGIIGDSMMIKTSEGPVPIFIKDRIFIESHTKIVYKGVYTR